MKMPSTLFQIKFLFKVKLGKEISLTVLKYLGLFFFPLLQFYGSTTIFLTPLIIKLSPFSVPLILSLTFNNF